MSGDQHEQYLLRVGVPLLAARSYYDGGHPEHQRLALILLDGAVESLLRRLVDDCSMWFRLGELMAEQNRKADSISMDPPHAVHHMTFPSEAVSGDELGEPVYLSKSQLKKLDREFGPSADVAVFFRHLSGEAGKALKHLHEYRNGAYHRNVVNLRIIHVLVGLQLSVVAMLLRSMRDGLIRLYPPIDWVPIRAVLGLPEDSAVSYQAFADVLDSGIALVAGEVEGVLEENLRDRLGEVRRRVASIKEQLDVPGVAIEDWILLIQAPQPWPVELAAIRMLVPPVTSATLDQWEQIATSESSARSALEAFGRFVDIDVPLTEFENQVEAVELQLDREVQRLIDERLGR